MTLASIPVGLWLTAIAVRDARTRRITNALLWPGLIAVAAIGTTSAGVVVAGVVAATPYLIAWLLRQCGGGDVKLALVVGGLTADWATGMLVVLLAALLSAIAALVARSSSLPHGPALVGASALLLAVTH
ncbi:MAG TPA: A24 family peptidase [Gordonia sp. (in: high G+C Gram-positive bacteria)]|nr:A24 family peptidase [Gordonia sp. (in: high G+C Gram-positive bacteria)]